MSEHGDSQLPLIEPNPSARSRWDYYQAKRINEEIQQVSNDGEKVSEKLIGFVFETHPDIPDFASGISYRFNQAQKVMESYLNGEELLGSALLSDLKEAESRLEQGFTYVPTATVMSSDSEVPKPILHAGQFVQKVNIPDSIKRRSLVWNKWVQDTVREGNMERLFTDPISSLAIEPARGTKLPVGNLVVEVVESLARIRTPNHIKHELETRWGFPVENNEWGSGLDLWFIATHIMEKGMLEFAETLGEDMIDGKKLTPEVYARSYIPILQLIDLNPQLSIQGVLSDGSWIYSPELKNHFPDQAVSELQDIAGDVVDLGSAMDLGLPEQVDFATKDPERRKKYDEGQYKANVAVRYIRPEQMREVLKKFDKVA